MTDRKYGSAIKDSEGNTVELFGCTSDSTGLKIKISKVSAKRQITLPVEQCAIAGINPGDEVVSFVDRSGIISIVKKTAGAAKGALKGIKIDSSMSDRESLARSLNK